MGAPVGCFLAGTPALYAATMMLLGALVLLANRSGKEQLKERRKRRRKGEREKGKEEEKRRGRSCCPKC
uniref:Uncharacterized protein n=1 Tax=Arundo donax TaxID=35708 RepID=A0A0A8XS27_ARUDO